VRIETPADYWALVDDCWQQLLEIVGHHIQLDAPAHEKPGEGDSPMTGRNVLQELGHLKKTRDPKIVRYFNAAWCMASEAYCWSVDRWGDFCDLCSEEWVLHDKPAQDPTVAES
jgi:hypothetical protein